MSDRLCKDESKQRGAAQVVPRFASGACDEKGTDCVRRFCSAGYDAGESESGVRHGRIRLDAPDVWSVESGVKSALYFNREIRDKKFR